MSSFAMLGEGVTGTPGTGPVSLSGSPISTDANILRSAIPDGGSARVVMSEGNLWQDFKARLAYGSPDVITRIKTYASYNGVSRGAENISFSSAAKLRVIGVQSALPYEGVAPVAGGLISANYTNNAGTSTLTLNPGVVYAVPFIAGCDYPVNTLQARVVTAQAGGLLRLGIAGRAADGSAGLLIDESSALDATTAGDKYGAIASEYELDFGELIYALFLTNVAGIEVDAISRTDIVGSPLGAKESGNAYYQLMYETGNHTFGAFATDIGAVITGNADLANTPVMRLS